MSEIEVVNQKLVKLYDDELLAVKAKDNQVYVSVNQMCEALGIASPMQRRRIREHEILNEGYAFGTVLTDGGKQRAALLRADLVPLWLVGIQINSVREDIRPKLKIFVQRAAEVLSEAFREGRLTAESTFDELLNTNSPAVQAYKMIMAMAQMARQQIMLEVRIEQSEGRLDSTEQRVTHIEERLENIESGLGDSTRRITSAQASQISQAVKAIGLALGKRSGRNEFGGVYGELYRRFEIAGYRELPAARFEEAMRFLRDWYQSMTSDADVPF